MSTSTHPTSSTDLRVGDRVLIRTGWDADRTATVTGVAPHRIDVKLDNGMPKIWRCDITGWMPRVEVLR